MSQNVNLCRTGDCMLMPWPAFNLFEMILGSLKLGEDISCSIVHWVISTWKYADLKKYDRYTVSNQINHLHPAPSWHGNSSQLIQLKNY